MPQQLALLGREYSCKDDSTRLEMKAQRVSREAAKPRRNVEELSAIVVDCGYKLHAEAGPGLLETVYEVVLARMLEAQGLNVRRQVSVPIRLMGLNFDEGFRADLLVENLLLVELKCVESILPVHSRQVVTYLRLLDLPVGLLINFGASSFKQGIKRIVNNHQDFAASRLRVNQNSADLQGKSGIFPGDAVSGDSSVAN